MQRCNTESQNDFNFLKYLLVINGANQRIIKSASKTLKISRNRKLFLTQNIDYFE